MTWIDVDASDVTTWQDKPLSCALHELATVRFMTRSKVNVGGRAVSFLVFRPPTYALVRYSHVFGIKTFLKVSDGELDTVWRQGVVELLQDPNRSSGKSGGGHFLPRDDPFLLARFAAGIHSPRIGRLRLSQLDSFGCCAHCPFPALLIRAQAVLGHSDVKENMCYTFR